jgi:uncharacterized protein YbjT (DUF2867 family)
MTVAIIGATGATGMICTRLLLRQVEVSQVISIGRRSTGIKHFKLMEVSLLEEELASIRRADAFVSCIGTTMNKAGSRQAFRKIDYELPVGIAALLKNRGCQVAAVLSALGADASSSLFYTSVKGQMEESIKAIGFKSTSIFRPSFIQVERTEARKGERLMLALLKIFSVFLIGPLRKFRSQNANTIAEAIVTAVLEQKDGIRIYDSPLIEKLAKQHSSTTNS